MITIGLILILGLIFCIRGFINRKKEKVLEYDLIENQEEKEDFKKSEDLFCNSVICVVMATFLMILMVLTYHLSLHFADDLNNGESKSISLEVREEQLIKLIESKDEIIAERELYIKDLESINAEIRELEEKYISKKEEVKYMLNPTPTDFGMIAFLEKELEIKKEQKKEIEYKLKFDYNIENKIKWKESDIAKNKNKRDKIKKVILFIPFVF